MSKSVKALIAELDKRKNSIAAERDKLRETLDEMQALVDDCDEAISNIEMACDSLSRMV